MALSDRRLTSAWPTVTAICAIAALSGLLTYWILAGSINGVRVRFDGAPVNDGTIDPAGQMLSYLVGLLVLGSLGLATWLRPALFRIANSQPVRATALAASILAVLAVAALVWLESKKLPGETYVAYLATWYATTAIPSRLLYALGIVLTLGLLVLAFLRPAFVRHKLLFVVAYLAVLVVTLYGIRSPITLQAVGSETLVGIEAHFTGVFGPAELLANGYSAATIGYGYLPNLLIAGLQEIFGDWDFADYVRFVQYGNVAYLVAALAACHLLARSRPMVAVGTLLLVAPWVHSAHQGLFFPNQAGWRFLAMPMAMAALGLCVRLSLKQASLLLGAVAGLAIAWNSETGIAVAFGCATYLFLRVGTLLSVEFVRIGILFAVAIFIALLGVALIELLAFGDLSLTRAFWAGLLLRPAVGSGYGLPFYLDVRAIVLGSFAGWIFAEAVVARGSGAISRAAAQRAAIAAMGLCWGAYYIARPDPWNLWSYLLPFGFLVMDRLVRAFEHRGIGALAPAIAPAAIVALVLGPIALSWNFQMVHVLWRQLQIPAEVPADVAELSGVRLAATVAEPVSNRANYIATLEGDAIAFTGNSFLVPKLSGRRELFPEENIVFSFVEKSAFDRFLARTLEPPRDYVLLDDPDTLDANGTTRAMMLTIQDRISAHHSNEGTYSGWVRWRSGG